MLRENETGFRAPNLGYRAARGELIGVLGADDVLWRALWKLSLRWSIGEADGRVYTNSRLVSWHHFLGPAPPHDTHEILQIGPDHYVV